MRLVHPWGESIPLTCGGGVDILFGTKRLERRCNNSLERRKQWGDDRGKLIGRRLDDLRAARRLEDNQHEPIAAVGNSRSVTSSV